MAGIEIASNHSHAWEHASRPGIVDICAFIVKRNSFSVPKCIKRITV